MKGRSHSLQSSDPPDDCIDGSWTVDCICGVNFDDGEEMVKCDDCGVWVHAQCSQYVKGDDTFACDKCKSKSIRTDPEETEVAQLLVELPTKTMTMESSFTSNGPSRHPFKHWADMESQVVILLFSETCPRFLVPNCGNVLVMFQKRLISNIGNSPVGIKIPERTRRLRIPLTKKVFFTTPVQALVDVRAKEEEDGFDRKTSSKEMNECESDDRQVVKCPQNVMKEEGSLLRPVMHPVKRKKEDSRTSKDQSGKKRVKSSEKEVDPKRRSSHSSKTAFTPTSDAKQLEFYEDGGSKIFKVDNRSLNNKNLKDLVILEHISDDYVAVDTIMEASNNYVATTEDSSEALYPDMPGYSFPAGDAITEEEAGPKYQVVVETSKTDDAVTPVLKHHYVGNASIRQQEEDGDGKVIRSTVGPFTEDPCGFAKEYKNNQLLKHSDRNKSPRSAQCKFKVKRDGDDDKFRSS